MMLGYDTKMSCLDGTGRYSERYAALHETGLMNVGNLKGYVPDIGDGNQGARDKDGNFHGFQV